MHAATRITATVAIIGAASIALSACAPSPGAIQPVSMGNAFAGTTCEQAAVMRNAAAVNLDALTAAQNGAVAGDAVGVFLIGVPMSSLTGGNKAGEIAAEKGKLLSLDARLAGCR